MSAKELLSRKYQELAAGLADSQIKREALDHEIEGIKARIKGLNDVVPLVLELESQIKAENYVEKTFHGQGTPKEEGQG